VAKQSSPGSQNEMPPGAVLEPEYAVGKGLITQDEFDAVKNEFFAQSELSVGLILPLICLAGAVSYWLSLGERIALSLFVVVVSCLLYLVAVERRFQYRFELKILILGRWDKAKEASKDTSSGAKPSVTETKQTVQENLSVSVELKPLSVKLEK
jgi:hypothetical protein